MNWNQCTIVFVLAVSLPRSALAESPPPEKGKDLAAKVHAVFAAKCTHCHGSNLLRPRGGFDYVLDLQRLAATPEKIVAGKPDESGLWQLIQNEEMPPPNSPTGALSVDQKEVIRAWIAAGAPVKDEQPPPPANDSTSWPAVWRTLVWLGKFHLLLLHFPIALLFAALIGELWSMGKKMLLPSPVVRFCVNLGAASAVLTAILGWLLALSVSGALELLPWHRWLGTTTGAWAVLTVICSEIDARRGQRSWWTRVVLLAGVVLVGITAHLGGLLTHGASYFNW